MIYSQSFFYYLISISAMLICYKTLTELLGKKFDPLFSSLISLTIVLHPLAIDSFLAPNTIKGALAFGFFLQGLLIVDEKKDWGIFYFIVSTICNIGYALFPIYFLIKYRDQIRSSKFLSLNYLILLGWYSYKHLVNTVHSPVNFISNMVIDIIAPFYISFFDYTVMKWNSLYDFLIFGLILFFLFYLSKKRSATLEYLPMIFLPIWGNVFHQWVEPYKFWDEFLLTPSNYLPMTFGVIVILAMHLPRKLFVSYSVLLLLLSLNWSTMWFPQSKIISESIADLPSDYPQQTNAKRLLAWQLFYEKKIKQGILLLNTLAKEHPDNMEIKRDLEFFQAKIN